MKNYGVFSIPVEESEKESHSSSPSKLGKLLKLSLIGSAIFGALTYCYKIDVYLDKESEKEHDYHSHNAFVVIPKLEEEHNYRDAKRLENEGWSYISRARRGEFRATENQLNSIANALNNNNTHGTKAGEPLD